MEMQKPSEYRPQRDRICVPDGTLRTGQRFLFFDPGGRLGPRLLPFDPGGRPGPRRLRRRLRPFLAFLLGPPTAPSSPLTASCTCSRTTLRMKATKFVGRGMDPPSALDIAHSGGD